MPNPIRKILSFNSSRVYLEKFLQEAAKALPAGGRVLDAGAGDTAYRKFFKHGVYESADFCKVDSKEYGEINYVCDLAAIPVEEGRYDLVVSTQVMEHLPAPAAVLKEYFRVLKPGAELWASAPFYFEEHEAPYDFFRYTQYGVRRLLEDAGFEVKNVQWLEGYFGTLAYQWKMAAKALPLAPEDYGGGFLGWVCVVFAFFLKVNFVAQAFIMARLDLRHKYTKSGHCKNYAFVAVKPSVKR